MPNEQQRGSDPSNDEFRRVVLRFVRAHRTLLLRDPQPLPEFVAFRNGVLDAAESGEVVDDTARALSKVHGETDYGMAEAVHLLIAELEAFSASVERASEAAVPVEPTQRPHWKRLLGIGKTTTDSLTEILDKTLGPKAKAIWKMLSELAEILRGD